LPGLSEEERKKITLNKGEDTWHGKAPIKASNFFKTLILCNENQERNMGIIFK